MEYQTTVTTDEFEITTPRSEEILRAQIEQIADLQSSYFVGSTEDRTSFKLALNDLRREIAECDALSAADMQCRLDDALLNRYGGLLRDAVDSDAVTREMLIAIRDIPLPLPQVVPLADEIYQAALTTHMEVKALPYSTPAEQRASVERKASVLSHVASSFGADLPAVKIGRRSMSGEDYHVGKVKEMLRPGKGLEARKVNEAMQGFVRDAYGVNDKLKIPSSTAARIKFGVERAVAAVSVAAALAGAGAVAASASTGKATTSEVLPTASKSSAKAITPSQTTVTLAPAITHNTPKVAQEAVPSTILPETDEVTPLPKEADSVGNTVTDVTPIVATLPAATQEASPAPILAIEPSSEVPATTDSKQASETDPSIHTAPGVTIVPATNIAEQVPVLTLTPSDPTENVPPTPGNGRATLNQPDDTPVAPPDENIIPTFPDLVPGKDPGTPTPPPSEDTDVPPTFDIKPVKPPKNEPAPTPPPAEVDPAPAPKAPEAPAPTVPKTPDNPAPAPVPETGPYQLNAEQNQLIDSLRLTPAQKAFLKQATAGAISLQQHGSKVNPEVVIAQAILESGWGGSQLTTQANNYFGMKAGADWKGKTVVMPTQEFENGSWITVDATWKAFDSAEDCFAEYAKFIESSPNFKDALNYPNDPQQYVQALLNRDNGQSAYATDPAYVAKIMGTVRANHIDQIADIARKAQADKAAADKAAADKAEADKRAKEAADKAKNQEPPKFTGEWLPVVPTGTPITAGFGFRGYSNGVEVGHSGVDFGAPMGTPFTATVGGKVELVTSGDVTKQQFCIDALNALGQPMSVVKDPFQKEVHVTTVIGNDTYVTVYAHLSAFNPALVNGGYIQAGQEVGKTGDSGCSTGPHAHFEVRKNGVPIDPNLLNDDPKWKLLAQGATEGKPEEVDKPKEKEAAQTIGQEIVVKSDQFDDYGYKWGGGYDQSAAVFMKKFEAGEYKKGVDYILDCGGYVRMSIFSASGVDIGPLQFNNGPDTVVGSGNFIQVAFDKAQPGDVFAHVVKGMGHVGIIKSVDTATHTYVTKEALNPYGNIADNLGEKKRDYNNSDDVQYVYRYVGQVKNQSSDITPIVSSSSETAVSQSQATSSTDTKSEKATDGSETTTQPAQDGLLKIDRTTPAQEASSDTSVAAEETVTGNGVESSSDKPVSVEVQAAVDSANRAVAMARQATKQAQSAQSLAPTH